MAPSGARTTRASTRAYTVFAPARFSVLAQASKVAPVVITSSIRSTVLPEIDKPALKVLAPSSVKVGCGCQNPAFAFGVVMDQLTPIRFLAARIFQAGGFPGEILGDFDQIIDRVGIFHQRGNFSLGDTFDLFANRTHFCQGM